jgi:hypothetical protein
MSDALPMCGTGRALSLSNGLPVPNASDVLHVY